METIKALQRLSDRGDNAVTQEKKREEDARKKADEDREAARRKKEEDQKREEEAIKRHMERRNLENKREKGVAVMLGVRG
jgi:hypothetical protein